MRGRSDKRTLFLDEHKLGPSYFQDQVPFVRQREAVGHAVRAQYLYISVADLLGIEPDQAYRTSLDSIWQDATYRKQYITGGAGAREDGEAFDKPYILPNDNAYAETCSAIANMLWNYKMHLLTGESKYMDVFERVLYNAFLGGMSVKGDEFFYVNPMHSDGKNDFGKGEGAVRHDWFGTACCPTNVSRFLPSMPAYIYAVRNNNLIINLFAGNSATIPIAGQNIRVEQQTNYPWQGNVKIRVTPEKPATFPLAIRIPGWATGEAMPGNLYTYADSKSQPVKVKLNKKAVNVQVENGYLKLDRAWKKGDVIELELDMPVRQVVSNAALKTNAGKVAIERGPVLYCAEGHDNNGKANTISIAPGQIFTAENRADMLGGVNVLNSGNTTLIPYYAWANRGANEMTVWFNAGQ
jgi:uncharacterized protein